MKLNLTLERAGLMAVEVEHFLNIKLYLVRSWFPQVSTGFSRFQQVSNCMTYANAKNDIKYSQRLINWYSPKIGYCMKNI